jgi:hypothetical protein
MAVASCKLQVISYQLQVSNYQLPITSYQLSGFTMTRKYRTNAKPPTFRNAPGGRMVERLMLLIIFQAARDAAGRDDADAWERADAERFLHSEDFYFFCDHLGIRPSLARRLAETGIGERR